MWLVGVFIYPMQALHSQGSPWLRGNGTRQSREVVNSNPDAGSNVDTRVPGLRLVDSVSSPLDETKGPSSRRLAQVKDPTAVKERCLGKFLKNTLGISQTGWCDSIAAAFPRGWGGMGGGRRGEGEAIRIFHENRLRRSEATLKSSVQS